MITQSPRYVCVITYQYDERPPYEVPSNPTSKAHAEWLLAENWRLNCDSSHVLRGAVYSEQDYRRHLARRS